LVELSRSAAGRVERKLDEAHRLAEKKTHAFVASPIESLAMRFVASLTGLVEDDKSNFHFLKGVLGGFFPGSFNKY